METVNENVQEATVVENMPQPETMNYEQTVKLSDECVNDMHAALDGFSYVEVSKIFNTVDQFRDAMPINLANEVIRAIASFPYSAVKDFMRVIETDQARYLSLNDVQTE